MGVIENFFKRRRERNRQESEFEDIDRAHSNIERKKLSHNEREMIAVLNREKENYLKEGLQWEEKRRKANELFREREMMRSNIHLLE